MKVVMNEGEDIWDEDVALREVRNLYITIDDIIDYTRHSCLIPRFYT